MKLRGALLVVTLFLGGVSALELILYLITSENISGIYIAIQVLLTITMSFYLLCTRERDNGHANHMTAAEVEQAPDLNSLYELGETASICEVCHQFQDRIYERIRVKKRRIMFAPHRHAH